ncbi:MAG: hypothetical protein PGN13_01365 [Patulibacter minatonensis]
MTMPSFRSSALLALGLTALALPSGANALPTPKHTPAPHCADGVVPVRGTVVDDGHANETGKGHTVHGQGFGYGHSCGGDTGGGDTIVS